MKHAQLLADIANYIETVGECNTVYGAIFSASTRPACVMCNAVRGGLIDLELGNKIDNSTSFSKYFDVTWNEAHNVLFHGHESTNPITTGENYYKACKELLDKHGYGHLLDKQLSGSEIVNNFPQLFLVELKDRCMA